jgi:homoserine dehydrogenase
MVSPRLIPNNNPLSGINDVFNGILVKADMVGEVMFYGPGAGKLPTASAVVADIIDIMSTKTNDAKVIDWKSANNSDIADFDEYTCKRVFVFKGTKVRVEGIHIVRDEMTTAILTEPKSEKEVKKIKEEFGDKILAVYRVLD